TGLQSLSSTPLCQSIHWPPFSVPHPSLPIPPLASTQCPPPSLPIPPLASNQCPPPSLPIPPLASNQCPAPLSANPSTGFQSVSSTPLCQSLHWLPIAQRIKFKTLTIMYNAIYNSAPNYITNLVSKYHPNPPSSPPPML
ncbi:unnamed protein product, partial [Staurois parvus]